MIKVKKILECICVNCGKLKVDLVRLSSFPLSLLFAQGISKASSLLNSLALPTTHPLPTTSSAFSTLLFALHPCFLLPFRLLSTTLSSPKSRDASNPKTDSNTSGTKRRRRPSARRMSSQRTRMEGRRRCRTRPDMEDVGMCSR
jgi:hypothetical protein